MFTTKYIHSLIILSFFFAFAPSKSDAKLVLLDSTAGQVRYTIETEKKPVYIFPGLTKRQPVQPKIGLALSGGGLKGIAHVGVIRALEEAGITIDYITGTSAGSIIGGLYSLGYPITEIDSIVNAINFDEILIDQTRRRDLFVSQKEQASKYLADVRFENYRPYIPISISPGQRIGDQFTELYMNSTYNVIRDFDHLKIPFRAVSTDLETGDRIVLAEGNWIEAVRASSSIPMVLSPVARDDKLLIDGGVADNIPISLARDVGADFVIAVDVRGRLYRPNELRNLLTVADQVITILMNTSRMEALEDADVVISPDFETEYPDLEDETARSIRRGYVAAQSAIDTIRQSYRDKFSDNRTRYDIREIGITGNEILTDFEVMNLADNLSVNRTGTITGSQLDSVLSRLIKSGYFDSVCVAIRESEAQSTLIYELKENNQVRQINLSGVEALDEELFRGQIESMIGMPYNPVMLEILLTNLMERYRRAGYPVARVDTIAWDAENGILDVMFSEGIIGEITIEGNDNTRRYVIRREVNIEIDDLLRRADVEQSLTNIYATELFDYVGAEFIPLENSNRWRLNFDVREKKYFGAKVGFRINNQRGDAALFTIENQNFFGQGISVQADAKVGSREEYYQGILTSNRFFRTYITYSLRAGYSRTSFDIFQEGFTDIQRDYIMEENYFQYSMGHQIARLGLVDAGISLKKVILNGPSVYDRYNQVYNIASIFGQSVIDTKDRAAFPTTGNYQRIYYEIASDRIGGDMGYTKFEFDSDWYLTFLRRNTLHAGVQVGLGDETIPYSEWFHLGGMDSFFGLEQYELWGTKLYKGSFEYRYRLPVSSFFDLNFSVRYDIAAITDDVLYDISRKDFFHGYGIGVGVSTPAGPLQIGYGRNSLEKQALYFYFGWDF